jgi:hypothetical protein
MEPLALLTAAVALVGAEVAKRCGGLLVDQTFAGLKAFLKGRLGREPQPDDLTPATLGVAQAGASPAFVEQARAVVARSSALRRAQLVRSAPFVGRPRMVRASAGRRYGPPLRRAGRRKAVDRLSDPRSRRVGAASPVQYHQSCWTSATWPGGASIPLTTPDGETLPRKRRIGLCRATGCGGLPVVPRRDVSIAAAQNGRIRKMPVDNFKVAVFDQNKRYTNQVNEAQAHGLCVALCAKWLRLRYKQMDSGAEGANQRMMYLRGETQKFQVRDPHRVGNKALERMDAHFGDPLNSTRLIVQEYHMDIAGLWPPPLLPTLDKVVTDITSTKRRMFIMVAECPYYNNQNHALAAYLSKGGHVHFFDPNEGEYIVNKNQFSNWFREFLQVKYGVTGTLLECWPVTSMN